MTKDNFQRLIKYGGLAAVTIVIAPFVFLLIQGIVGLIAAVVIAGVANALIPAFSSWLAQVKFGALRAIISRAPVDELLQRGKERAEALATQAELLKSQATQLQVFKMRTTKLGREYPEEAQQANETLAQYEALFAYRVDAFKQAKQDTETFMRTVDKAEAMYAMAVEDAKLGASFGKQKDYMAQFREKTAFEAIDKANAQSLATLRMALVDAEYGKDIEAAPHAITYDAQHNVVLGNVLAAPLKVSV